MKFVKTEDLCTGMRLAKPIYNNKGVLLYDRNSKLTIQGIESVKNFKLIGLYVLEPAEPLPPISEEDMEFEKFQMVSVFAVKDELSGMLRFGKTQKFYNLTDSIVKRYGRLDHKINFIQNLRSASDYVYKHSLNVGILTALIMNKLKVKNEEKIDAVTAALVHDIGKLKVDPDLLISDDLDDVQMASIRATQYEGISIIESTFIASPNVKRAVLQSYNMLNCYDEKREPENKKMVIAAKALTVAEMYDRMTAMNLQGEIQSEVAVLRTLLSNPEYFDPAAVDALIQSINFLAEGCCVELSNGERALVLSANPRDILRPTVLCFTTNTIVDLAQTALYSDLEIVDIMKTLDNRYVMGDDARNSI